MKTGSCEIVNCIADVLSKFTATGKRTPAGGECYIHPALDMCATVYDYGRMARVFYKRREGFEHREKAPCFFSEEITLRN